MREETIGTTKDNFVSTYKTREGGSLSFSYSDRDIVANTIGHVMAIPNVHLPLLTLRNIFQNPPKELAGAFRDRWKDVPWKGDVLVRVGHTSVMGDIQRLLASYDEIKGKPIFSTTHDVIDRVARILYVPLQVMKTVTAKISRKDHYDPITNTAIVFHPNLAVGMHEIGHAQFLDEKKKKEPWVVFHPNPIIRSFMEWKASAKAMKRFANDEERRSALKVLEPAFATSLVPDVLGLSGVTEFSGLAAYIGTVSAGHIMARFYPRRDQRFEYVFEGKTLAPPPAATRDLKPHEVLVSTARPTKSEESQGSSQRHFSSVEATNGKQKLHSNYSRVTF